MVDSKASYTYKSLQQRLNELQREANQGSEPLENILFEAFDTLQKALGALQAAEEKLHQQAQEARRVQLPAQDRESRLLAETLGEVYLVLTAQISYEAVLDEILNQVQHLVSYSAANIVLLDGYNLRPARWQGYENFGSQAMFVTLMQPLADLPLDHKAVQTRQPLVVSDTRQNPEWVVMPETAWIRSFMAVPIPLRDRVLALLRLDSDVPHRFSVEDARRLLPLANTAAVALENARLHGQARREIEERKQVEKELRRIVARNQIILDAIPDSIFFFSREGILLDFRIVDDNLISPETQGEIAIGTNLGDILPPDLTRLIQRDLERVPKAKNSQIFEYQFSSPFRTQEYEVRLVASGSNEALAIIRNVTDRKRAEQLAIRSERLAALGKLTAALAHELNNPLQAIQGHLDLLLKYPSELAKGEEYLRIIYRNIERMNNISQNVLNLARPQPSQRQKIEVVELVQEVLELASRQIEDNDIQVSLDVREIPQVAGVPNQLTQVFLNLVINAIEAISVNGQLHVSVYPEADEVAISFTSNGPAIPPEILPHIFDPFFTTKPHGSGLGLWICHNLIEQHSGSLTVENLTDEAGVVFTVKLPVASPV